MPLALDSGRVRLRRLMLVGSEDDLASSGRVAGEQPARPRVPSCRCRQRSSNDPAAAASPATALRSAGDEARSLGVDDVLLLPSTRHGDILNACLDCFALLPVSIHLDAFSDIEAIGRPKIEPVGPVMALTLSAAPERPVALLVKRVFDLVVASLAVIVLALLLLLCAVLIKLDSSGRSCFATPPRLQPSRVPDLQVPR